MGHMRCGVIWGGGSHFGGARIKPGAPLHRASATALGLPSCKMRQAGHGASDEQFHPQEPQGSKQWKTRDSAGNLWLLVTGNRALAPLSLSAESIWPSLWRTRSLGEDHKIVLSKSSGPRPECECERPIPP